MNFLNEITEQKYSVKSIQSEYKKKGKLKYIMFWGHRPSPTGEITKTCLSNWWKSSYTAEGLTYSCTEQFMMAAKARLFGDEKIFNEIMNTYDQKQIKSLGRKVHNFDENIWNKHKFTIVYYGNLMKFSQDPRLKNFLLNTGDKILVEASPYDKIWGIQMSADEYGVENPLNWRGENLLGFALMQVRDELRQV